MQEKKLRQSGQFAKKMLLNLDNMKTRNSQEKYT